MTEQMVKMMLMKISTVQTFHPPLDHTYSIYVYPVYDLMLLNATVKNCKNPQIAWIYALKTNWKSIARSIDHNLSKKA